MHSGAHHNHRSSCLLFFQLIPGDAGPYDPSKFALFCPIFNGVTLRNVSSSVADTADSVPVNRLFFSVKVKASRPDFAEFAKSLDNCLPVFFTYLNVALARADVPLNVKNEVAESFNSRWVTLLFGFEPESGVSAEKDVRWIRGQVRVRAENSSPGQRVVEHRSVSKISKSSGSNAEKSVNSNSDGPHNSTDSILEEILNHYQPVATEKTRTGAPVTDEERVSKLPTASVAVGTSNEDVRSRIVWKTPRVSARNETVVENVQETVNRCQLRVGVDKIELCGISEVDQIFIT